MCSFVKQTGRGLVESTRELIESSRKLVVNESGAGRNPVSIQS